MKIKNLLKKELMIMDLKATSKLEAINEMVKKLKDEGIISDEEMFKDFILKREEKGTTGLGDGIAMPHAKTTAVKIPAVLFAKSKTGVDYEALDGEPVHIFFMIAATEGAHDSHIETLAKLSKMLINDEFVKELMTCENPDKVHELVRAIKESNEVKEYMALKEELYKDVNSKEMIKDFREKQVEVQSLLMQGKEADNEKMEKLQSLYQILVSNPKVKEFFDKEVQFDVMLSDIYKIIGEALKDIMD